jgi:tetratricopeptide (TPR) repeat protein
MRQRTTSKPSTSFAGPDSVAAATLAECRRQLRNVEQALTPDPLRERSQSVVAHGTISYTPLLARLEDTARTLRELISGLGGSASDYPARMVLGTTHSMMGRLLATIGESASAAEHYTLAGEYFEKVPHMMTAGDEDAARHYVQALENIGRRKDAVDLLVVASSLGVLSLSFYLEYASVLNRSGDAEDAGRLLLAAGRRADGNPEHLYRLGDAAQSDGQLGIAREAFWDAADLFGEVLDWRKALEACRRALDIDPRHKELLAQRGSLLVKLGRYAEALPYVRQAEDVSVDPSIRLDLARAYLWSGEIDRALASIREAREVLCGTSDDAAALCLEAKAYNQNEEWVKALGSAEEALLRQPGISAALVERAIAANALQQHEAAWECVEEALSKTPEDVLASIVRFDLQLTLSRDLDDPAAQLKGLLARALELGAGLVFVARPLLRVLRRMGQWEEFLGIIDRLVETGIASDDLFLKRVSALRQLGRQDEAMRELDRVSYAGHTAEFFLFKSALLCDVGDFEGALALLVPATTPLETASHLIVTLRGWADQNCTDDFCAVDGERVYRRALELKPEDDWSRKGLANALMRLGKKEEAFQDYDAVINVALEKRAKRTLDPYDSCLAGWCFYCTNRFKEAADFYESGLAAVQIGVAAQFDYALVLLADGSLRAARFQYEKSIRDAKTKNLLRQCGLLYVALFDLRIALVNHAGILRYPETYEFRRRLREALQETLEKLPVEWGYLAQRFTGYMQADEVEAGSQRANWVAPRILGVTVEDLRRPCAVLSPVFREPDDSRSFFPLPASVTDPPDGPPASTSILLISAEMLSAMGLESPWTLEAQLAWSELEAARFWVAVTTSENATRALDHCAELLIGRSVALLTQYFQTGKKVDERRSAAAQAARFALAATSKQRLVDRAILALGAADSDVSDDTLKPIPGTSSSFVDPEDLKKRIREFKELVELRACAELGAPQNPESSVPKSENSYIQRILKRAYDVAQIADRNEQYRAALQAATEMQILVPLTEDLKLLQEKLADDLRTQDTFYLENDQSVLLMSCEPPFYASSVLVALSGRPGVYSMGFMRAADRISRSPAGFDEAIHREQSLQTRTLWNRR